MTTGAWDPGPQPEFDDEGEPVTIRPPRRQLWPWRNRVTGAPAIEFIQPGEASPLASDQKYLSLTPKDRCDNRCPAQAFVRVVTPEGELLFCAHHYKRHQNVIMRRGYEVLDQRDLLNTERPAL